jgi:uncharacterized protein YqeY
MSIKEELANALKDAMKTKDVIKKNTVRMILAGIKNSEIDNGHELDENEIYGILQKQLKMRNDTIKDAIVANRQDIVDEANAEIIVIQSFLPESMSEPELKEALRQIVVETGAESMRDMGEVMKTAVTKLAGKASNADISRIIRELLTQ